MTVIEKRMVKKSLQLATENHKLRKGLEDAMDGVRELNLAVDAVLIGTALQYGARLPDGGMVLTMDRPAVALTGKYNVLSKWDKRGCLRVEVREREKKK